MPLIFNTHFNDYHMVNAFAAVDSKLHISANCMKIVHDIHTIVDLEVVMLHTDSQCNTQILKNSLSYGN